MNRVAYQFPGQGSQVVGMGVPLIESFAEARDVFAEADDVLGIGLTALCREGPEHELTATENAQPALLTHSVAVARVLESAGMRPSCAAGHSLGEFSAHVVAGSLSFADGVRLVRARGEAMAAAGTTAPGTMGAVIGMQDEAVRDLCRDAREGDEVLAPANYNAPGQIVLSGSVDAIRRALDLARDRGARMAVELNVSGAFHSPLMAPAAEALTGALVEVSLRRATIPVVANVDAVPVQEPDEIRARLLSQLTSPVRWVACVHALRDLGATRFIEAGTGKVLTGLLRRIDRTLSGAAVGGPEQVMEVTGG